MVVIQIIAEKFTLPHLIFVLVLLLDHIGRIESYRDSVYVTVRDRNPVETLCTQESYNDIVQTLFMATIPLEQVYTLNTAKFIIEEETNSNTYFIQQFDRQRFQFQVEEKVNLRERRRVEKFTVRLD
ncbi:hypothetical protein JHK82_048586 [Glycine max]|nr:hypothetical protein JHK82_048586 [Glycine max]